MNAPIAANPERTATACRRNIRAYAEQVVRVLDAQEPTLEEIAEIEGLCKLMAIDSRRWHSAEALIAAAPRRSSLHPLFDALTQPYLSSQRPA